MNLLCDGCGRIEKVVLMQDTLMQFECGNVSEITKEDRNGLIWMNRLEKRGLER